MSKRRTACLMATWPLYPPTLTTRPCMKSISGQCIWSQSTTSFLIIFKAISRCCKGGHCQYHVLIPAHQQLVRMCQQQNFERPSQDRTWLPGKRLHCQLYFFYSNNLRDLLYQTGTPNMLELPRLSLAWTWPCPMEETSGVATWSMPSRMSLFLRPESMIW